MFVDYGNVEECEANELRTANALGNVPIQARKYYLAYVKPISDDGKWKRNILEFIHVNIVNKSVYLRVEDNVDHEHVPCTLTVGPMDLIKTLIAEKLAERTDELNVNLNLPDTYDYYQETPKSSDRDVHKYRVSDVALDEFIKTTAKKSEAKKEKEYLSKYDLNQSIDYFVEESVHDAFQKNSSFDTIDYEDDFEPHETSTIMSTSMKSFSLLPFEQIKLSKDVTKFPCTVYEVLDTLHLFVEPIIQEYTDNFEIMEKMVKKASSKRGPDFDVSKARFCLAPYSADDCYYRAIIVDRISKTHVRVRFVDYLNSEIVESKLLRECPPEIVTEPLKHLLVKLHGIKPCVRLRESDIKRKLLGLAGQTVIALVVEHDTIPSVRLYDKENSNVLAYKPLIDSKFFTVTKD